MNVEGFFPRIFLENLKIYGANPGIYPYSGTTLFVDLSGFTKISEFFAQFGKEGSETLTKVLNEFFSKFYCLLSKYDGDILRFAGDALTCFFKDDEKKERVKNFSKQLLKMMKYFENYGTKFGNITLKLKGGYARGNIHLIVLGKEIMDYTFAGFGINKAVEAEKNAKPGEIIENFSEEKKQLERKIFYKPCKYDLDKFINFYLKGIIERGEKELIAGHRKVVVLFLKIGSSFSFDEIILNFIEDIIILINSYGGFLNKIDFSDKGNVLMVLFGAPVLKGEEIERAIEFALSLKRKAYEKNIPIKVGINYENVYCGIVGSQERFEYTVMGDGVNLSARLMEISYENEITCSKNLEEKSPPFYFFEKLPAVKVKGKEKPIEISVLKGKKGELIEAKKMIGREVEFNEFRKIFLGFKESKPFLCFIYGPSGVGKSHFLNYFFDKLDLRNKNLFYSRANSMTSSISLNPLKELLIQALKKIYGEKIKEEILSTIEKEAKEIKEYIQIILEFLELVEKKDLKIPSELYKNLLNKFILIILKAISEKEIYFFIDNAHFLDNETIEFFKITLKFLEEKGLFLFFAGRDNKFKDKSLFDYYLELKPLNEKETKEFSLDFLKVKEMPEKALKKIYSTAGGNPQFIQEILKLMLKTGFLERSGDFPEILILNETVELELPETLEGLALKEFDMLQIEEKKVLQIFSIIGENISLELIDKLKINKEIVEKIYKDGIFLGFNPHRNRYFFIKQTYRDAIYESLEFSFKRNLHNKIGEIFEKFYKEEENLICYHFTNASSRKAIYYLNRAYENAKKSFALQESYKILKNLIEICRIYKKNYKKYLIELSNLCLQIGQIQEGEKILRENENLFKGKWRSKYLNVLGEILRMQGAFKEAEELFVNSIKFSKEKVDKFKAYFLIAKLYSILGRYEKAKIYYRNVLNLKGFSFYPEYHNSIVNYSYILYEMEKDYYSFEVMKNEANWFNKNKFFGEYLITLSNLSGILVYEGKYQEAIKNYKECLEKIYKFGYIKADSIINVLFNISLLSIYLGNFNKAEENILKAISFSKKFNSPLVAKSFAYLLFLKIFLGIFKDAFNNFKKAMEEAENLHYPYDEFLQFGMDLAYETGNIEFFGECLKEYKEIIERENLQFLIPTLINYEVELSILENKMEENIEKVKLNFRNCKKENLLLELFRSLRFLWIATKEKFYLKEMEKLFRKFEHFLYKIEFLSFKYEADKDEKTKKKLLSYLKKCPDNTIKLKALIALKNFKKAKELFEKLKKNLPEGWDEGFRNLYKI